MTDLYLWMGGLVMALAAFVGTYLHGRSSGAKQERQSREAAVAKQQTAAREAVRRVENEIDSMGDVDIRGRASEWVRHPSDGGDRLL